MHLSFTKINAARSLALFRNEIMYTTHISLSTVGKGSAANCIEQLASKNSLKTEKDITVSGCNYSPKFCWHVVWRVAGNDAAAA